MAYTMISKELKMIKMTLAAVITLSEAQMDVVATGFLSALIY